MEYSDIPGVFDLVHLMVAHGITDVVLSPGSRNAPLSISLHRHPNIKTYVIPDERVAAFYALGMAQQKGKPVMICCTSGSAVLNYAPAIAEAFYQRIPLLVITADRPEEWIDQGDGQTIRQKNVYQNYVRFSTTLIQNTTDGNDRELNRQRINEAISKATQPVGGPVHINFPLNEPLYRTRKYDLSEIPQLPQTSPATLPDFKPDNELIEPLNQADKILILCALIEPDPVLETILGHWAEKSQVVVLTETTSNLNHPRFFPCIDRLIFTFDEQDLEDFHPDLLITLGHQIISKKIKAILRQHKPRNHWHIDPDQPHPNTFQALTRSIYAQPTTVLQALAGHLSEKTTNYQSFLKERDKAIDAGHDSFLQSCEFSDLKAVEILLNKIPTHYNLHLGNSASVRYVQLFKQGRVHHCNSNRGTSGIDGCTSTTMGAAEASKKPTLLLSGDMAFLYDSNSFWHPHVPRNIKMVVLNNGGGGIFRIIDGPQIEEETATYFEAHHQQTAGNLAAMFGIKYHAATNAEDLREKLDLLFNMPNDEPVILEIFTPRMENDKILKAYFSHLKLAVTKSKTHG